jgi:hypothetical protein
MRIIRYCMLSVCVPIVLQGQAPLQGRHTSCEESLEVIRNAAPGRELAASLAKIGSCPPSPVIAMQSAVTYKRLKTASDTAILESLLMLARRPTDVGVTNIVLDVIEDRTASEVARIVGIAAFMSSLRPQREVLYEDLVGGVDEHGLPRAACSSGQIAGKRDVPGIPEAARTRMKVVARKLFADTTEQPNIRSAAACWGG